MTDAEKLKKYLTIHRKAVRRDYFRRKAIEKKMLDILSQNGVFTWTDRFGRPSERSVAVLGAAGNEKSKAISSLHVAKLTISSRKTMPERDGEKMGQTDYLSSSSGCDMPTGITTIDQAIQPGQEQKPALTDRKDE